MMNYLFYKAVFLRMVKLWIAAGYALAMTERSYTMTRNLWT